MNAILLLFSFLLIILVPTTTWGQFAPPAGQTGSTAIHKDSSILIAWANGCQVQRGPLDIRNPTNGNVSNGTTNSAMGSAGDGTTLSLGDGGQATLTFLHPIKNGPGADFAIFENAFSATFLELAFVEVSSDGSNFVRFPAISNTDTTTQVGSFGAVDATKLYNLAGKYQANYGTPFDLEELVGDSAILDVNRITHVRIIDVVGCIQDAYAQRDSRGYKINDPWTTPFASGGFDLDAVGVIHHTATVSTQKIPTPSLMVFPNPIPKTNPTLYLQTNLDRYEVQLFSLDGQEISINAQNNSIRLPILPSGIYILRIQTNQTVLTQKIQLL
jgi:hypothetical protein